MRKRGARGHQRDPAAWAVHTRGCQRQVAQVGAKRARVLRSPAHSPESRASPVATMCSMTVCRLTQHSFIAEQQIHNKVLALGLLAETATAPGGNLETSRIEVVADRGYFRIEDIGACEAAGVTSYVRVSAANELRLQLDALAAPRCEPMFTDHASGARSRRPRLDACVEELKCQRRYPGRLAPGPPGAVDAAPGRRDMVEELLRRGVAASDSPLGSNGARFPGPVHRLATAVAGP